MKKSSFVIFLSIVLSVYGLVNYYIYITGLNALPQSDALSYTIIYLFLSLSYIIGRFLERKFPGTIVNIFVWIGSFWLAAMVYFLLFVVLIDLLRFFNIFLGFIPAVYSAYYKQLIFDSVVSAVIIIVLLGYINARNPVIKKLNLSIHKRAGKLSMLKIAVASDIHLGTIISRSRLEKIVDMINSINADIILLPGDVVDEDIAPVIRQNLGEVLKKIRSKYGVFAVTGNHEYIGGVKPACKYLAAHGITELRDSYVKINESFYIVGREDLASKSFAGILRKPLGIIMDGIDRSLPIVLMDHQPVKLAQAEKDGIDLQLSGHTHHGQLWPFNFITKNVYTLSMGYLKKGNTHYYVSCGVGTWGPPVRTGNRPEIIQIDLTFNK